MEKASKHLILFTLCFPTFFGYIGLNTGQMFFLALFFVFCSFEILIHKNLLMQELPKNFYAFLLLFLFLAIVYFVSLILNFKNNNYGGGDFIEGFRPVIYLLTFLFSCLILSKGVQEQSAGYFLDYFERIVFVFSILEFLKFIRIFESLFLLYTPFKFGTINYIRMFGMTGFAYSYAWLCSICLFWNINRKRKITMKFFYYSFIVLLTGSRTGLLALCFDYFLIFIFFKKTRKTLIFCVLLLIGIITTLYILNVEVVVTSIDYMIRLVKIFLFNEGSDGSLNTRNRQNSIAFAQFWSSPLLGVGSNKAENVLIENFYFHHLRNWGLIGIFSYLIIIFSFFFTARKRFRKFVFATILISLVICFSCPIFDQIRIFNMTYIFFALSQIDNPKTYINTNKKY